MNDYLYWQDVITCDVNGTAVLFEDEDALFLYATENIKQFNTAWDDEHDLISVEVIISSSTNLVITYSRPNEYDEDGNTITWNSEVEEFEITRTQLGTIVRR